MKHVETFREERAVKTRDITAHVIHPISEANFQVNKGNQSSVNVA